MKRPRLTDDRIDMVNAAIDRAIDRAIYRAWNTRPAMMTIHHSRNVFLEEMAGLKSTIRGTVLHELTRDLREFNGGPRAGSGRKAQGAT